ncbi:MAG TPA: dihydrolipoyl dehydrogenase [Phycisphaerae bacterium]|nr:dihydrolipoyl dehydrogenase [Phycisphaerae bacterium]
MVVGEFTQETDLLVIGGGPGGYTAAFRAAQLGVQTTIVEATEFLGGVCLHVGCIPSKTLLWVAELAGLAEHAAQFGVELGKPKVNLDKVRQWKEGVTAKLAAGLDSQCKRLGVERVRGRARFEDSRYVAVQDSATARIKFKHAIIATGSESIRLKGIEIDSPQVMDSTGALKLEDVPGHLLVVGGGYIGLELGSVYAALGSEVTVVEMMPGLLPGVDADLVRPLARRLKDVLTQVCLKTRVTAMKEAGGGVEVAFEGDNLPQRNTFDRVLVSVGRRPNTDGLQLAKTQVKTDPHGFIKVNQRLQTDDPRIYAIGDVVGNPMLAHKASHEGKVCADVIAGHDNTFDARAIPAVVFTDPEIAWCGLTEAEAKAAGTKVVVKKIPWGASGRAVSIGRSEGVTKMLFDPQTHRILGVGMCGLHAGEMIAEGVLAMEMGAVATDLAATIHPHPTLSEMMGEVADMMELGTLTGK